MGKFDVDKKYIEGCSVSWHFLYMDLVDEFENSHPGKFIDEDTIRDKFTNKDGSGLVDKLKSVLDFDIDGIAGADATERFDMFKILKLLFYIEKYGDPKTKVVSDNYRVQITDILAKPRLANVPSEHTPHSIYGEYFEQLYSDIKKMVNGAEKREQRLQQINEYWEYITDKVFDYVINDRAMEQPEEALVFANDGTAIYPADSTAEPDYRVHTAVKGDTLWDIAVKYLGKGSRYTEIKKLNGLSSNVIYSGWKLKIPN